ncbi:MAG: PHP domain-containing protein, partial [Actinomycetota bacterium]
MKDFTHLHLASGYSFKYGTTLPDKFVAKARDYGMSALALTDRDGLAGAIRFVGSCVEYSIAPIIGVDCEFEENSRITLLATPGPGWSSLVRLVTAMKKSEAPLSLPFLQEHSNLTSHLLALHGSDSLIGRALLSRRYEKALAFFNQSRELFLDQGIECVSHLIYGDGLRSTTHAARMLGFARDHNLPALLTNSVRMLARDDAPIADILDATRRHLPLHKKVVERQNAEAFFKDSDEMALLADQIARATGERNGRNLLRTTRSWAEQAILSPERDIGLGSIHLPEPEVVGARDQVELIRQLRDRSYAGVDHRYRRRDRIDVIERLEKELSIIRELGYESYFLTVADITDRARAAGIRVAARGSGAGSLVCHLLGISGVEPLSLG